MRLLGAHLSTAGGLDKAIERAKAIDANCVQVFSGSPRVWARSPLTNIPIDKVFSKQEELGVKSIVTHAIYLTNLASDNPALVEKSVKALQYDLEFDALVKGSGVVVHLGSHQGRGWAAAREQVAGAIKQILDATPAHSTLLIENSAGQNGKLCSDLEEIRWLFDQVGSPRLGWCVDTCHAHAAGYHLVDVGANDGQPVLSAELDRLQLWPHLKCVHVNDSKDPFGSGRDRHENLGDGQVSALEMKAFVNLPQVQHVPLILEVPGIDNNGPDKENLDRLKKMISTE